MASKTRTNAASNGKVQRHPLGDHGGLMLYPDNVLRALGVTQPIHPNQAVRMFWRYVKDKHLLRRR